jgi:hypothetical protein
MAVFKSQKQARRCPTRVQSSKSRIISRKSGNFILDFFLGARLAQHQSRGQIGFLRDHAEAFRPALDLSAPSGSSAPNNRAAVTVQPQKPRLWRYFLAIFLAWTACLTLASFEFER